eukprot:scaffold1964_cov302-Pinguiococcus_pyrenoidosus.AAC.8
MMPTKESGAKGVDRMSSENFTGVTRGTPYRDGGQLQRIRAPRRSRILAGATQFDLFERVWRAFLGH